MARSSALTAVALLLLTACSDDSPSNPMDGGGEGVVADGGSDGTGVAPSTYRFNSRFSSGSSVSYPGQTTRHLLIAELASYIGALSDTTFSNPKAGDVVAALEFFYRFAERGGSAGEPVRVSLPGGGKLEQKTFGDLGDPTTLREKIAGISVPFTGGVVGWGAGDKSPDEVVAAMFAAIEALVIARVVDQNIPKDPDGGDISKTYVSAEGIDYEELMQKFLLGAIAYSQASDKYLDDGADGIDADNTKADDSAAYSALEHHWDEAFGYFGAARNFGDFTDDELAGADGRAGFKFGYNDADANGSIDAGSELNFGHAVYAGKRDRGSADSAKTDFSGDAWQALIAGRHLIASAGGALDSAQRAKLGEQRDAVLAAWEKTLAASAVHYINNTLQDLAKVGTKCDGGNDDVCYKFLDQAKHWSELKGFALALQFNPHAKISAADIKTLHEKIGAKPVLPGAGTTAIDDHKKALRQARAVLHNAFAFDAANIGDDEGKGGW